MCQQLSKGIVYPLAPKSTQVLDLAHQKEFVALWCSWIKCPSSTGALSLPLMICIICTAGLNLAVFRDERGVAHALDAYCPHMGANLGAGGRVKGNCLECPFHAWRFRGDDGKCTHIPYTDKSEYHVKAHD